MVPILHNTHLEVTIDCQVEAKHKPVITWVMGMERDLDKIIILLPDQKGPAVPVHAVVDIKQYKLIRQVLACNLGELV